MDFFSEVFFLGFSSHSRIIHSYGYIIVAGEGLEVLTCVRHSGPFIIEGSLACHTKSDTGGGGHPFIIVISEDP